MAKNVETVTLYLAGWQKRMLKDFMPASLFKVKNIARVTKVAVAVIDKRQWVMYRQPMDGIRGSFNLYLTDEQIAIVGDRAGVQKLSALNISPDMVASGAVTFG
jgi:hypothetical protein